VLVNLINDRGVADAAIVALMKFDHPDTAKELLSRLSGLRDGNRSLAIDTMASRESYALDPDWSDRRWDALMHAS
jgi:hypothetical protein